MKRFSKQSREQRIATVTKVIFNGKTYHFAYKSDVDGVKTREYLQKGESFDDGRWKDMIGLYVYSNDTRSPKEIVTQLGKHVSQKYGLPAYSNQYAHRLYLPGDDNSDAAFDRWCKKTVHPWRKETWEPLVVKMAYFKFDLYNHDTRITGLQHSACKIPGSEQTQ